VPGFFFTNSWRESGFSAKEFSRNIKKTWSYLGKSWKSGRWCGRNSSISELNHIDYIESSQSSLALLIPGLYTEQKRKTKNFPQTANWACSQDLSLGFWAEAKGEILGTRLQPHPNFSTNAVPCLKASQIPDTKKTGIFRSTTHVDRACSIIDRMHVITTAIDFPHKIEVKSQLFHRKILKPNGIKEDTRRKKKTWDKRPQKTQLKSLGFWDLVSFIDSEFRIENTHELYSFSWIPCLIIYSNLW